MITFSFLIWSRDLINSVSSSHRLGSVFRKFKLIFCAIISSLLFSVMKSDNCLLSIVFLSTVLIKAKQTVNKSKELIIAQNINLNFLNKDPSLWEEDTEFIKSRDQIKKLKVINDVAERGILLIDTFNPVLTKQEKQKQYLLQVVENQRKQKYSYKKSIVLE